MKEMRAEIRVQKLINGRWRWSTVVVVVVMVLRQGTYMKECEEFLPFRPFSHYQKERREVTKFWSSISRDHRSQSVHFAHQLDVDLHA